MDIEERIGLWVSYASFLIVATGLMLVVCGLARAEPMVWSGHMPAQPPAEYAHPYEGKLTLHRIPLQEMAAACRNVPRVLGCAYWDPSAARAYCTVYLPNDVPARLEAAILKHELGHCHGWKHPYDGQTAVEKKLADERAAITQAAAVRRAKENPICQEIPRPEACP